MSDCIRMHLHLLLCMLLVTQTSIPLLPQADLLQGVRALGLLLESRFHSRPEPKGLA